MIEQQQQIWQQVLALTSQIRELARPNDSLADLSVDVEYAKQPWHKISELETQRRGLLKEFFSYPIAAEDSDEVSDGIAGILESDQEVKLIGQSIKKQIGETFAALGHAQRVASAYASNTGK